MGDQADVAFCLNFDCPEAELERRCAPAGSEAGSYLRRIDLMERRCVPAMSRAVPVGAS